MKIKETLLWILDDKTNTRKSEEIIKENVSFVHAMKLKCGSVGWCQLDLSHMNTEETLKSITIFSKEHNFGVRGYYERSVYDIESQWYLLKCKNFMGNDIDCIEVEDQDGGNWELKGIYAYKIPRYTAALWQKTLPVVSEEFKAACIKNKLEGIDFYWKKDIGKYKASQYFDIKIKNKVEAFASDRNLSYEYNDYFEYAEYVASRKQEEFKVFGGALPQVASLCYDLRVHMPIWLEKDKMPDADFAYIYLDEPEYVSRYVCIRKNAVELLISEGVINASDVQAVPLYDIPPKGYSLEKSADVPYPSEKIIEWLNRDYEEFLKKPRPERKITEKMAVDMLKSMKKAEPKRFRKGINKFTKAEFEETPYQKLFPYYTVADGGSISYEYELLELKEAAEKSKWFMAEMAKEELLPKRVSGIVIADCADGDVVLVDNGKVKRISHETMDVWENWDSVAQFFYDELEHLNNKD